MFSPLTQNITDLLAVPCIFVDQGCTIKLKKSEIVNHEKEKCKYREHKCPGCEEKILARTIPDHFINCPELYFKIEDLKLDRHYTSKTWIALFQPVVTSLNPLRIGFYSVLIDWKIDCCSI